MSLAISDHVDCVEESRGYLASFESLLQQLRPWLSRECKETHESNILLIKASLLLYKSDTLNKIVKILFAKSFDAYKSLNKEMFKGADELEVIADNGDDIECSCCLSEKEDCRCGTILATFTKINKILAELNLIEDITNPAIVGVVYDQLTNFIETHCKGEFLDSWLNNVFDWTNKGLIAWIEFAASSYANSSPEYLDGVLTVEQWKPRLEYFVYKAFAELRISELFEIIVEYPESLPAINDLKECMLNTETRQLLTESLRASFENRLLDPAVTTDDILTQYVSAIRTLRELDPTGVILENVCAPLREYLRSRDDTIKCIITCLTDPSDLAEELLGADIDAEANRASDSESDGEDWMPDPIDAKADLSSKDQRTADIINILVNIYGSQDMFVSQYRVLLANRILTNYSYDITNERRYLELLKRRFGENNLHYCDIMLKDIQDSQRINRHVKDEMEKEKDNQDADKEDSIDFNAFILSSAFWPALVEDSVEPPDEVKKLMETYTEHFKQLKGMRTLEWHNDRGSVELEVELEDGGKTFNVAPAQAMLLIKFQEKDEWSLNDLSLEMSVNRMSLRSRLAFWIGQGVIIEKQNDIFVAAQTLQSNMGESSMYESDDDPSTAAQNQKEEAIQVYWSYVVGMLTNIGYLPLERIHSMLRMFAAHGENSSQLTIEEVKSFLQSKVADCELLYAGGMYSLPKS